ncbi:Uma2 family endonuclease [Calothrix sp. FACHB-1219]|uniref:Uma2 family endonuclease n=1 Tax=unclassified Calothrix TaxID=2619626 RepID=UPI0016866FAD|nr:MULTISPECIES: Uma2 family endonuclease [unclassified Calothrix]MBD2203803.1 Uma2 family endonuclease [Calothrix sp. FACHB-168]MBD2219621.1 Uma2 family endonuclease [Calothrix sp. FACHB-1219]
MLLKLNQLIVPVGHQLLIKNISWSIYKSILAELGENRSSRISYSQGMLEIMAPLPEHEVSKKIIGNLVEILLEELDIDFWSLGSTTFDREKMDAGVEPDDCFYIQNEAAVRGKDRIDLTVDPPPDLAIEIDITSRTRFNNYEVLGVPELWRWKGNRLEINVMINGKYVASTASAIFPNLPITQVIPEYLMRSKTEGRNAAMRAFRAWVREQI